MQSTALVRGGPGPAFASAAEWDRRGVVERWTWIRVVGVLSRRRNVRGVGVCVDLGDPVGQAAGNRTRAARSASHRRRGGQRREAGPLVIVPRLDVQELLFVLLVHDVLQRGRR